MKLLEHELIDWKAGLGGSWGQTEEESRKNLNDFYLWQMAKHWVPRTWCAYQVETFKELCTNVFWPGWPACRAFEFQGYWFLNDPPCLKSSGDALFAAVKRCNHNGRPHLVSVVSKYYGGVSAIEDLLAGLHDSNRYSSPVSLTIEAPAIHICPQCAVLPLWAGP